MINALNRLTEEKKTLCKQQINKFLVHEDKSGGKDEQVSLLLICFLTTASKHASGTNNPLKAPEKFFMPTSISFLKTKHTFKTYYFV